MIRALTIIHTIALVTFHHAFLALRSQDLGSDAQADNLSDCELLEEEELYGG